MVEKKKLERIQLVGGPGDGERYEFDASASLLRWQPRTREEELRCEGMGFVNGGRGQQFMYRRSIRSRGKFVYQP